MSELWSAVQSTALSRVLQFLDWVGGLGVALTGWAMGLVYVAWDAAIGAWVPIGPMRDLLLGATGHVAAQMLVVLLGAFVAMSYLRGLQRNSRQRAEQRKDQKVSPLNDHLPLRLPFLDRMSRPLRISRQVTVDLKDEHGTSVGMTGSGKSSCMAGFVTGQEATFGLLFDVSMPTIAAARRLQRRIVASKLYARGTGWRHFPMFWRTTGKVIRPPVYVWRPRDKSVVLRLLEGIPEDVMDSIRDAFARSSGDTGHQWGIVFERGIAILKKLDERHEPRTLTALSDALRTMAMNKTEDLQTRNACWSWATKLHSLKAMFGEAEGASGMVPAEILDAGGTLLLEFNTFASKATAEAISGFALRILASALNYCHVPVMVLIDESGQMKGRAEDIAGIFRAARARGGRVWLCTQDPTDLLSAMAVNIGIWVIYGAGAGAIKVLQWMASITHGRREAGDYIMNRRTWAAVLLGKLGMRKTRIHRECDVIYEGSIVFTTVDAPNGRTLKRDLHYVDWPNNRGKIPDAGLTASIPIPPLPEPPEPVPTPPSRPKRGAASTKVTTVAGPQHPHAAPIWKEPRQAERPEVELVQTAKAGTFGIGVSSDSGEGDGMAGGRGVIGPSPWPWINEDARRVEVWRLAGEPTSIAACWLVPEQMVQSDGRASFSYYGEKLNYAHVYEWAGCPNGKRWKGCYMDHSCHNIDETCAGGRCVHLRCINPFTLMPVSPGVSAQNREAHKRLYQAWLAEQAMAETEAVEAVA